MYHLSLNFTKATERGNKASRCGHTPPSVRSAVSRVSCTRVVSISREQPFVKHNFSKNTALSEIFLKIFEFLAIFLLTNGRLPPIMLTVLTGTSTENALVAQLDRVFDYESKGQGFESLRARQKRSNFCLPKVTSFFIQAAGLAYHHASACISSAPLELYIITAKPCIIPPAA